MSLILELQGGLAPRPRPGYGPVSDHSLVLTWHITCILTGPNVNESILLAVSTFEYIMCNSGESMVQIVGDIIPVESYKANLVYSTMI